MSHYRQEPHATGHDIFIRQKGQHPLKGLGQRQGIRCGHELPDHASQVHGSSSCEWQGSVPAGFHSPSFASSSR